MSASISIGAPVAALPTTTATKPVVTRAWPLSLAIVMWGLLIFGSAIRISQLQANRSLWLDEVMLAQNIVDRSVGGLLQPLDYHQEAPLGFLMLTKICVITLGNTEVAFRLIPMLASIASLGLFCIIGRRFLTPVATVAGLSLLVFGNPSFRYAIEAKPYAMDMLWSLAIVWTAMWTWRMRTRGWLWLYALVGVAAVWFSYPSVFVLGGVGGTLIMGAWYRGDRRFANILTGVSACWMMSFLVLFFAFLRFRTSDHVLQGFWDERFMPLPPTSVDDLKWYISTFFSTFRDVMGLELRGVGALAFVIGSIWLVMSGRKLLWLLTLPIAVALVVSAFGLYPFGGRLLLFAAPLIAIVIGFGIEAVIRCEEPIARWCGLALVGIMLLHPIADTAEAALRRPESQEVRPLVEHLRANWREGDVMYVYHGAIPAFKYYAQRAGIQNVNAVQGISPTGDWNDYAVDLKQVSGNERAWVLMSHISRGEVDDAALFKFLLGNMGQSLEEVNAHEAVLLLYDLRGRRDENAALAAARE